MIERLSRRNQIRNARKLGVAPSTKLRPHFLSLARQVRSWSAGRELPVTVGVTSLEIGSGSSTVSFNLAAALASIAREPVALVEADFGNAVWSRRLGAGQSSGLSELLSSTADSCELVETPLDQLSVFPSGQISGAAALELPFDLIPSLVQEHLSDHAFAIFDLPVASNVTACYSLAASLDAVILTVEMGKAEQRQVTRFKQQMSLHGVPILGIVVNKS